MNFFDIQDIKDYGKGMTSFNEELDRCRYELSHPIFPVNYTEKYNYLKDIVSLESGEYSVSVEDVKLRFLFQRKNSQRLYVFLNGVYGSKTPERKYLYQRWSWSSLTDASVLNILDPMYLENESLLIGWYYGTKEIDYRQKISLLIRWVANEIGVQYKDIILYGSSAGGTAAIYSAHYIPGCTVVAINAQLRPWRYEWYPNFYEITGINMEEEDKYFRNDYKWHIEHSLDNKFFLLFNHRSRVDYNYQCVPLLQSFNIPAEYGLEKHRNIYLWTYDTGEIGRHKYLDFPAIFMFIDSIVKDISDNRKNMYDIKREVLMINEMWRAYWNVIAENDKIEMTK